MITFKGNPNWIKGRTVERSLAERIAFMVVGREGMYTEFDGEKWKLGKSNDWWLRVEDNEFTLSYRYGADEKMKSLKKVIIWLLGLEEYNE